MPCFISARPAFSCSLSLLSWNGWANSLARPTCCYHEWKAVVETKVNGHWNKLTFFSTLWSGSILMLYLVQNSIYNLVSLPGLAWPGPGRKCLGCIFWSPRSRWSSLPGSWQEVSVFIIWPRLFLWWLEVFPNNNDNKLWESKLDYF